jgi:hypothetical protein
MTAKRNTSPPVVIASVSMPAASSNVTVCSPAARTIGDPIGALFRYPRISVAARTSISSVTAGTDASSRSQTGDVRPPPDRRSELRAAPPHVSETASAWRDAATVTPS